MCGGVPVRLSSCAGVFRCISNIYLICILTNKIILTLGTIQGGGTGGGGTGEAGGIIRRFFLLTYFPVIFFPKIFFPSDYFS